MRIWKWLGKQAAIDAYPGVERVLAHIHQVPKGWVVEGKWAGEPPSWALSCVCHAAVIVALGRVIEDWPRPRWVESVYVCSDCGLGADQANKKFTDRVSAAFAERLGVTPPAPTPAAQSGAGVFQQAIAQQQAQLAADLRHAEFAQSMRNILANPMILSDYMEGAILGAKGGGDK